MLQGMSNLRPPHQDRMTVRTAEQYGHCVHQYAIRPDSDSEGSVANTIPDCQVAPTFIRQVRS